MGSFSPKFRIFLMAFATSLAVPPAAQTTSPTVKLGDVFDLPPEEATATPLPSPPKALLLQAQPELTEWKLPTNSAESETGFTGLTAEHAVALQRARSTAALPPDEPSPIRDIGRAIIAPPVGMARLTIHSTSRRLRGEYVIKNIGTGDTVTFLHGPDTSETMAIDAGNYQITVKYWFAERPERPHTVRYQPIQLLPGKAYDFSTPANAEQRTSVALSQSGSGSRR